MKSGVREMLDVLDEMRYEVEKNRCGMSDMALRALAKAVRTLYRSKVPKRFSRDGMAKELGVSTRTLNRMAKAKGIAPRRDGFKNIYYLEEDLLKFKTEE